jgi:hypothetical protein
MRSTRALDGLLVVRRRRGAGDARALDRIRVEERHRAVGSSPTRPAALDHVVDGIVRCHHRVTVMRA